jgi:hypothetical protein
MCLWWRPVLCVFWFQFGKAAGAACKCLARACCHLRAMRVPAMDAGMRVGARGRQCDAFTCWTGAVAGQAPVRLRFPLLQAPPAPADPHTLLLLLFQRLLSHCYRTAAAWPLGSRWWCGAGQGCNGQRSAAAVVFLWVSTHCGVSRFLGLVPVGRPGVRTVGGCALSCRMGFRDVTHTPVGFEGVLTPGDLFGPPLCAVVGSEDLHRPLLVCCMCVSQQPFCVGFTRLSVCSFLRHSVGWTAYADRSTPCKPLACEGPNV